MKTKQRNIRVFEIECDDADAVKSYIDKNKALLEGLTVMLGGSKAKECVQICKDALLCYAIAGDCGESNTTTKKLSPSRASSESKDLFDTSEQSASSGGSVQVQERIVEKIVEKVVVQTVYVERDQDSESRADVQNRQKIIKNVTVRSGEDIVTNGDVSIFARVNSGAKIKAEGCVEVFDTIDGLVECSGEYMLIKSIGKGTVMFGGSKLEAAAFDGSLKKVSTVNGKIEIRDL